MALDTIIYRGTFKREPASVRFTRSTAEERETYPKCPWKGVVRLFDSRSKMIWLYSYFIESGRRPSMELAERLVSRTAGNQTKEPRAKPGLRRVGG